MTILIIFLAQYLNWDCGWKLDKKKKKILLGLNNTSKHLKSWVVWDQPSPQPFIWWWPFCAFNYQYIWSVEHTFIILCHSNSHLNVNRDSCKDLQGSITSGVGLFLLSSPIMYFFLTAFKLPQSKIGQDHNRWPRSYQGYPCMGWGKFITGLILFI